jgi:hypothetical protein
MGNRFDDLDSEAQHDVVQIVDLGSPKVENVDFRTIDEPVRPNRRKLLVGGTLIACVFGGLTLLPSTNDGPPPAKIKPTIEAVSACSALQMVEQREASRNSIEGSALSRVQLPPRYIVSGVTVAGNDTILLGVDHPDGTFEVCEEAAQNAPFTVDYLTEADLGQLPDGMTYAYDWSSGFTDDTVTLNLQGVRQTDGTVTENLTLPDGRTVPAPQSH